MYTLNYGDEAKKRDGGIIAAITSETRAECLLYLGGYQVTSSPAAPVNGTSCFRSGSLANVVAGIDRAEALVRLCGQPADMACV